MMQLYSDFIDDSEDLKKEYKDLFINVQKHEKLPTKLIKSAE